MKILPFFVAFRVNQCLIKHRFVMIIKIIYVSFNFIKTTSEKSNIQSRSLATNFQHYSS